MKFSLYLKNACITACLPIHTVAGSSSQSFPPNKLEYLSASLPAFFAAKNDDQQLRFYRTIVELFLQKFALDGPGPYQCSQRSQHSEFAMAQKGLEIVSTLSSTLPLAYDA